MRQLLLRVPDELHARIAAQAARDGRSMNQIATEILESAIDPFAASDPSDARMQLRARAAALGMLAPMPDVRVTPEERAAAIASTRGIEPFLDDWLDSGRDR